MEVHLVRLSASQVGHLFGFRHQHPRRDLERRQLSFQAPQDIFRVNPHRRRRYQDSADEFAPLSIGNTQDYCLADLSIGLK